ncbi:MAG: CDP-diacylglycerol--glycerol-3-phosphate 3-phosphatidyltransferase [Candidatus Limnocylindria bacterium]
MADRGPVSVRTLPNMLGLGRIAATPVIMILLLVPAAGTDLLAGLLFAVAGFSDYFDGRIARSRNQVSPLGVFMDLAADKVLVAGVLIAMVEMGLVPTWIAATILIREFIVQAVRQLAAADDVVISAGSLGKAKTVTTLGGLGFLFLASDALTGGPMAGTGAGGVLGSIGYWTLVLATILTVVSGIQYLRGAWSLLTDSRGPSHGG